MNIPINVLNELKNMPPGGRVRRMQGLEKYYQNPKRCIYCNQIVHAKPRVGICLTKQKKFCNQQCAAKYNNKKRLKNKCLYCDKLIYKYQKYCSRQCCNDYKYNQYIQAWLDGEKSGIKGKDGTSTYIRRWLFEKYNSKCSKCGWNKINKFTNLIPLTINHIDGNWKNNRPENLELICPNCHSLTSNYGGHNKGKGRPYRYKMRA